MRSTLSERVGGEDPCEVLELRSRRLMGGVGPGRVRGHGGLPERDDLPRVAQAGGKDLPGEAGLLAEVGEAEVGEAEAGEAESAVLRSQWESLLCMKPLDALLSGADQVGSKGSVCCYEGVRVVQVPSGELRQVERRRQLMAGMRRVPRLAGGRPRDPRVSPSQVIARRPPSSALRCSPNTVMKRGISAEGLEQ